MVVTRRKFISDVLKNNCLKFNHKRHCLYNIGSVVFGAGWHKGGPLLICEGTCTELKHRYVKTNIALTLRDLMEIKDFSPNLRYDLLQFFKRNLKKYKRHVWKKHFSRRCVFLIVLNPRNVIVGSSFYFLLFISNRTINTSITTHFYYLYNLSYSSMSSAITMMNRLLSVNEKDRNQPFATKKSSGALKKKSILKANNNNLCTDIPCRYSVEN